jgi:hypothetical protein
MMTYEQPAPDVTCDKPAPDAGLHRVIRANVMTVVFEVIVPMVLFYGLRAAGVSQWWALMAGVLVAAPYVGWTVARNRRVDLIALFTLSVLALSVVLGLLSDDPRTLAIREGWTAALGGLFGLWMLVTVVAGKPAQLTLGRTIAEIKRAPRARRRGRPGGTPMPGSGAACASTRPSGAPCCSPTRWRTSCSSTRCRSTSSPWSPPWNGSPRSPF